MEEKVWTWIFAAKFLVGVIRRKSYQLEGINRCFEEIVLSKQLQQPPVTRSCARLAS